MSRPPRHDPPWLRDYWPLYLVGVLLAFTAPETLAIWLPGQGGTLSEWTRDTLGLADGQANAAFIILTMFLAAFAVWFPIHLLQRWPWEANGRWP